MKRIAYFGTFGNNEAGHYFREINGEFSNSERKEIVWLDGGCRGFDEMFKGKCQFKFFHYLGYLGLAFPASPDDERGGSRTIVLVEGTDSRQKILEEINGHQFLKSQFNRLCELYNVRMPQM